MKKILFCAGLVALATSCTQDETLSLDAQNGSSRGLTFEFVEGVDSRIQYDKEGTVWAPFWYAETDRINLWANGVKKNPLSQSPVTVAEGYWSGFAGENANVQYKATKSQKNGQFTSVDDANLLEFVATPKMGAKFLAVYPYSESYTLSATSDGDTISVSGIANGLAAQTIESAKGYNKKIPMFAYNQNVKSQYDYNSVGETVGLTYKFATPVIKFGTEGLTSAYQTAFGNLKKVTLTMKGYTDASDATKNIAASKITYSASQLEVDTLNFNHKVTGTLTGTSVVATIGSAAGLAWSDDALAPVAIAGVDRSDYNNGAVETYTAIYDFANIELPAGGDAKVKTTSKSWTANENFLAVTLKMSEFSYLVTKTPSGLNDSRTLFVIKGDFSDILTADRTAIDWYDTESGATTPVPFTDITKVVVEAGVVLEADDFKVLSKLTNVTDLTLTSNTAIPADGLKALTKLTTISLPAVTSVGAGAFAAPNLAYVSMPAYKFNEGLAINEMLLIKGKLVKLNMGADNMNASFPANGLSLEGFANLTEVTVVDGIKLGANSFKGCTKLAKVNGRVDIVGTGAFQGCAALTSVIVSDKDIVDQTFNGCTALANVYYDNATTALKPEFVGKEAFRGTAVNLDLSETTTISNYAFADATALVGYTYKNQKVVKVGATTVGAGAFSSLDDATNKTEFIYFMNATTIGDNLLEGSSNLMEIKFGKPFTYGGTGAPSDDTFGTCGNIKLFIVEGQTGIAGNTLTIGEDISNSIKRNTFSFSQIEEEEAE